MLQSSVISEFQKQLTLLEKNADEKEFEIGDLLRTVEEQRVQLNDLQQRQRMSRKEVRINLLVKHPYSFAQSIPGHSAQCRKYYRAITDKKRTSSCFLCKVMSINPLVSLNMKL